MTTTGATPSFAEAVSREAADFVHDHLEVNGKRQTLDVETQRQLIPFLLDAIDELYGQYPGIKRVRKLGLYFDDNLRPTGNQPHTVDAAIETLIRIKVDETLPPELNQTQSDVLAHSALRVGSSLDALGLPLFAELMFATAENHFGRSRSYRSANEAAYRRGCMEQKTAASPSKYWLVFSRVTTGFGYRPYRLITVSLFLWLLFGLVYIISPAGYADAFAFSATAQLGGLGFGDLSILGSMRWLALVQSAVSVTVISVFFALIVQRWFRRLS